MRFILFNIAVGTALVYLFNTGLLPLGDLRASIDQTTAKVVTWTDAKISQPKPAVQPPVKAVASGDEIISEPKVDFKREIPKLALGRSAKEAAQTKQPFNQIEHPKLQQAPYAKIKVEKPTKEPVVGDALFNAQDSRSHFTETPNVKLPASKQRFTIKAGTSMMSAHERRRELDALAEEMEMLYIKKLGG